MPTENFHCVDHGECKNRIATLEKKTDTTCHGIKTAHKEVEQRVRTTTFQWVIGSICAVIIIAFGVQWSILLEIGRGVSAMDKQIGVLSVKVEGLKEKVKENRYSQMPDRWSNHNDEGDN